MINIGIVKLTLWCKRDSLSGQRTCRGKLEAAPWSSLGARWLWGLSPAERGGRPWGCDSASPPQPRSSYLRHCCLLPAACPNCWRRTSRQIWKYGRLKIWSLWQLLNVKKRPKKFLKVYLRLKYRNHEYTLSVHTTRYFLVCISLPPLPIWIGL